MIGAIVAGALSEPVAPSFGSYESIQTYTVGSGGASSITFNLSGVSGYKHLQLRASLTPTSADNVVFQFNGDTSANYSYHYLSGSGANPATAGNGTNVSNGYFGYASSSSYPTAIVADILDYVDTSKYKTVRNLLGIDANGSGYIMQSSSLWRSTSAVTSIVLKCDSQSFAQYSSFALYGIKG